jgi:hypothetical protein
VRHTNKIGWVDDHKLKALPHNWGKQITLTYRNLLLPIIEQRIDLCTAHRMWVDIDCDNLYATPCRNKRLQPRTTPKIERPRRRPKWHCCNRLGQQATAKEQGRIKNLWQHNKIQARHVLKR